MSNTVVAGSIVLSPLSTVDTSSFNEGVSTFELKLDASILTNKNVLYAEYWKYSLSGNPLTATGGMGGHANGFIGVSEMSGLTLASHVVNAHDDENEVVLTIPIPSSNNVISPIQVQVRLYLGFTNIEDGSIGVTDWTPSIPIFNPLPKPVGVVGLLVPNENVTYDYSDVLYVQFAKNDSYNLDNVKFVVSYNYEDQSGNYQWAITDSLPTTEHDTILQIGPIVLPFLEQVNQDQRSPVLSIAVNALFDYELEQNGVSKTFYTVSEISDSAVCTVVDATSSSAVLADLDIPNDYNVYTTGEQSVSLSWTPPVVGTIENFEVESYQLVVTRPNSSFSEVVDLPGNVTETQYQFDDLETSEQYNFKILTFLNGKSFQSNIVSLNTFAFASAPRLLTVSYAIRSDPNNVTLEFSFANPSSFGLGGLTDSGPNQTLFDVDILDDNQNVLQSLTIPWDPEYVGNQLYVNQCYFSALVNGGGNNLQFTRNVTRNGIAASSEIINNGTVNVRMSTTDTNNQGQLAGPTITQNWIAGDKPVVTKVITLDEDIEINVESSSLLIDARLYFKLGYPSLNTNIQFVELPIVTTDGVTVAKTNNSDGTFSYVFNILFDFMTQNNIGSGFTIVVVNNNGMGSDHIEFQV